MVRKIPLRCRFGAEINVQIFLIIRLLLPERGSHESHAEGSRAQPPRMPRAGRDDDRLRSGRNRRALPLRSGTHDPGRKHERSPQNAAQHRKTGRIDHLRRIDVQRHNHPGHCHAADNHANLQKLQNHQWQRGRSDNQQLRLPVHNQQSQTGGKRQHISPDVSAGKQVRGSHSRAKLHSRIADTDGFGRRHLHNSWRRNDARTHNRLHSRTVLRIAQRPLRVSRHRSVQRRQPHRLDNTSGIRYSGQTGGNQSKSRLVGGLASRRRGSPAKPVLGVSRERLWRGHYRSGR
jgi:hypothetical protein